MPAKVKAYSQVGLINNVEMLTQKNFSPIFTRFLDIGCEINVGSNVGLSQSYKIRISLQKPVLVCISLVSVLTHFFGDRGEGGK